MFANCALATHATHPHTHALTFTFNLIITTLTQKKKAKKKSKYEIPKRKYKFKTKPLSSSSMPELPTTIDADDFTTVEVSSTWSEAHKRRFGENEVRSLAYVQHGAHEYLVTGQVRFPGVMAMAIEGGGGGREGEKEVGQIKRRKGRGKGG